MTESISDQAVACAAKIQELQDLLSDAKIADYGDATGFCEESDCLMQDAAYFLNCIRGRARRLVRRIKQHQDQIPSPS